MGRRILFYSSVASRKQFVSQEYYRTDIKILRGLGYRVALSNHWYDFIAFWRYEVAFIYFYRFGFLPALIARLFRRRVFFSGGIDYLDRALATRKQCFVQSVFYNLCGVLSTRNIIVSDADLRNCERIRKLFPASRQVVVKHSIGDLYFRRDDGRCKEKLVVTIAWMGRVENVLRKGVIESLEVFRELLRRDSGWRMLVIGPKGEGTRMVEARVRELGLESRVDLTGRLAEELKVDCLDRAQIYLQLSKYEGFGIAALEALARGCVVVHSGAGGLAESVGRYGICWDAERTPSVVAEVLELLNDSDRLAAWTGAGYAHVLTSYSVASRSERFCEIIE
jgi:glycosyltransferase involved in cell wall biosynthesis